ncbi:MAG TPA: SusC/RagA family TonB-linked outer membrane protein [Ferruginibacter sp.]|nr:SusC/RagA family TonB-linked outer membrane protein [Ferruginibacter sp.]HPH90329.1 SusC/RagA family TonB-linked outer membrane protein [Ferruginibacter sp.]
MKKKNKSILTKMAESIALTFVIMLLTASAAMAQSVVTGKVTESNKNTGLAGVTVTVKGTNVSTQTGADGTFKLSVPAGAKTLSFTSIGYSTQDVAIGGQVVNASLVESAQQLVDVVVVAYGTRKKTDLTGAVTQISAKDFQKGNNNSAEQLLQGKVAGVQITSGGGTAGGGSRIRIRGGASLNASNDPLVVIDGVPVESNGIAGNGNLLNMINPNDIESMSVLKDASATALYGSRASNGVLIVTTKKGTKGRVKFNFGSQLNIGKVTKTVDVLSANQLRQFIEEEATKTGTFTWRDALGNANTDWQKLIYQDATGWDNTLSMSGAIGGVLPFRLSGGYLNQTGIIKTDKFERYTGALNLSPKLFDNHLSVNLNLKLSQVKSRFADAGAVGAAASFDPTQPVNAANKYGGYFEWLQDPDPVNGEVTPIGTNGGSSQPNPLSLINFRNNQSVVNRFIGNINLDYKFHFLPDLHVLVNFGKDHAFGKGDDIYAANNVTQIRSNIQTINGVPQKVITSQGGFGHYAQFKDNTIIETSLFYTKELKSLKFDVLAGHTYQDFVSNNFSYPFLNSAGELLPGSAAPQFPTDKPQNRLESYLGRVNITAFDKYLVTASIRRDASSKFAPENRVGYFPSVAVAWKLKEELFKTSTKISELKLRFGWGITGQQDGIGLYSYLPVYSVGNSAAQYQFGSTFYGFTRPGAYDPNIKWETTTTTNIGVDFGFFSNRITGSVEVYQKKTKDLLSLVPVAAGANFDIQLVTNVGNVENKGVEFTLNTTPVKSGKFQWDFGFNVTYNEGKITNLLKNQDPNFKGVPTSGISGGTGNNIGLNAVGYAPSSFFMYKQVYDQESGRPIEGLYEDLNRDGVVNESDRYIGDKPGPDVLLGINTQFSFGAFSLGLAAHGMLGNYAYNNYASNAGVLRAAQNPLLFTSNISADYLNTRFVNNQYLSDYYISNASFLRLDNINIGYNVGKIMGNNRTSLRINASVQNVLVITKYKGLDPEIASDTQVDNNIYPRPRVFSLGFNLDF